MKTITLRNLFAALALSLSAVAAHAQVISTVAGNGTPTFGGDGFAATMAQINGPRGVAFDLLGNMYIADNENRRVRKVDAAGNISTYAGTGTAGDGGDGGPATAAQFRAPYALAFDHSGNMYVADGTNNNVRKITPSGMISLFAGHGGSGASTGDGGPATAADIADPSGVAVDAADNVYITSPGGQRIRKVDAAGIITTVAGTGTFGYSGDGGPATAAMLNTPHSVAFDAAGNMYIADQFNGRIRKVTPAGIISTVAGNGTAASGGDGGPATAADILNPTGIAVDAAGTLYIASYNAQVMRTVNTAGIINHLAGVTFFSGYNGDGGLADTSQLNHPYSVTAGYDGNIYIADQLNNRIRKIQTAPCTAADAGIIISTNGNTFCIADSSMLYINGTNTGTGLSYQWQTSPDGATWANTGSNTPGHQTGAIGATPVQYRLIATCIPTGISDTTTPYVIVPAATVLPTVTVTASPATAVPPGTTVTFTAAVTNGGTSPAYQWLKNRIPVPGAVTNPYITSTLAAHDTITCIAYSSMPCAMPDSALSAGTVMSVGLEDVRENSLFSLSPNPNTGIFRIAGNTGTAGSVSLQVLDMVGQVVYKATVTVSGHGLDTQLAMPEACANGTYLLRVQTVSGTAVMRFYVQR